MDLKYTCNLWTIIDIDKKKGYFEDENVARNKTLCGEIKLVYMFLKTHLLNMTY